MKLRLLIALLLGCLISSGLAFAANSDETPESAPSLEAGADGVIRLSLQDAMQLAQQQSVQSRLAEERSREAQAVKRQHSSGLLPHFSAGLSQYDQTLNLAALGFTPEAFPGITSTFLGPFGVFDARLRLAQTLFDLTALAEHQIGKIELRKAKLQEDLAREQAELESSIIYLELLRFQANLRGNRSDVELAEKTLKWIRDQHGSGLATSIDLARAQTQLSQFKSQVIQSETRVNDAELRLKRSLALPLAAKLRPTDKLALGSASVPPVDQILVEAQAQRLEIQVAKQEVLRTKAEQKAAFGKQLPSLVAEANYGASGNRPEKNLDDTYQFGVALNIPVFDGGATLGKLQQAKSQSRQAEILFNDVQTQVEQDVRNAYQNLEQAKSQVRTSEQSYELARRELSLVRDQYSAGLGDSLALVTAENSLTRAREEYFAALTIYQASRLMLAYSIGEMKGFKL